MTKLLSNVLVLVGLSFIASCSKEAETTIPDWTFRTLDCDIRQEAYSALSIPGYFMELKTYPNTTAPIGYAGLIIGHSAFPGINNEDVYYAYDSACPVEADRKVAVEIVDNNYSGKAACPKCGAQFDLNNGGAPISGSSNFLKRYTAIQVNDFIIRIISD